MPSYRGEDEHSGDSKQWGQQSLEDVKMWRAQQNTRDLYRVITKLYNDPHYLKWVIGQAFASTTDLMTWLRKIDQYTSKQIPIPGCPGEYYSDPYQDTQFITELTNTLLKEWAELSKDFDATSRVAMRDYMLGGWKFPYDMVNPEFFIAWAGKGQLLILTGEKDSGKSDWSCEMARIAIERKKFKILSNIELDTDVIDYNYCKLFSEMVKKICDFKLRGYESILIIDEAGLDFPSYEQATREAKEFDKFAKLTRKFATNEVFIIQYEHQVPWTLRKHYAAWMHKMDTKIDMRYELKTGKYKGFDQVITGIPRTSMPFSTDHISGMTMDLEVREMLDYLDTLPPKVNQFQHLIGFVDRRKLKPEDRKLSMDEKKFLALKLDQMAKQNPKAVKVTPEGLAKVLQVSQQTITKWKQGKRSREEDLEGPPLLPLEKEQDDEDAEKET